MNLQDKCNFHHFLARAYQEGLHEVKKARSEALLEAKQAIAGLTEVPGTCLNPGDKLSKAAAARNTMINRANYQIDQLIGYHFDHSDDDIPF